MATRLLLLCCSATASARSGGFPGRDESLDEGGRAKAKRRSLGRDPDIAMCSPARAAIETAAIMGLAAKVEDRLADMDFGRWEGRSFAQIHADQPEALEHWIAKPEAGAPLGESLDQVRRRVRGWLSDLKETNQSVVAITHPSAIRAILAEALELSDRSAMRIDIAPLSATLLSFNGCWRMQELRGE
jgi:broad specificity phosphatase PhoE